MIPRLTKLRSYPVCLTIKRSYIPAESPDISPTFISPIYTIKSRMRQETPEMTAASQKNKKHWQAYSHILNYKSISLEELTMSDVAATNCGCDCGCGCQTGGNGCNIIWILLILCCCGGGGGFGGCFEHNNCGCGNDIIWILLILCCCGGNGFC